MADNDKPTAQEQRQIDEQAKQESLARGGTAPTGGSAPVPQGESYGGETGPAFHGYPMVKYHPVYGKQSVNDPNEAAKVFQPPHNWFNSAPEADAARTDREAQQVVFHNLQTKVADKHARLNNEPPPAEQNKDRQTIVRNSVTATENLNAGKPEPL